MGRHSGMGLPETTRYLRYSPGGQADQHILHRQLLVAGGLEELFRPIIETGPYEARASSVPVPEQHADHRSPMVVFLCEAPDRRAVSAGIRHRHIRQASGPAATKARWNSGRVGQFVEIIVQGISRTSFPTIPYRTFSVCNTVVCYSDNLIIVNAAECQ